MRFTLRRFTRHPDPAAYKREDGPLGDGEWIEHLDGTDWFYADVPPRWHHCWPQTRGWIREFHELVERCACGSLRFDGYGPWINRNSSKPLSAAERRRAEWTKAAGALVREYEAACKAKDWVRCEEIRNQLRLLDDAMPCDGEP